MLFFAISKLSMVPDETFKHVIAMSVYLGIDGRRNIQ